MKRRKLWFIGLALALLVACVGAWTWSERPPYQFMQGARLNFVQIDGDESQLDYVCDLPADELLAAAKLDIRLEDFHAAGIRERWMSFDDNVTIVIQGVTPAIRKQASRLNFAGVEPPLPASSRSIVQIYRVPTVSDRIRARIYSFRWERP